MQPRIYTYKVTFEDAPYWYWGVHKERKCGEKYLGSPCTNRWVWDFYTPEIQILEVFDYSDEGWNQALEVERRLICPDLNNPLCLNESCAPALSRKACVKGGKKSGKIQGKINAENGLLRRISSIGGKVQGERNALNKTGVCGRSKEKMIEDGRKGGATQGRNNAINKTGFCNPEVQRLNGKNAVKNKTGIHSEEFKKSGVLQKNARALGSLPWWVNSKGETKRNSDRPGEDWIRGRKWKEEFL